MRPLDSGAKVTKMRKILASTSLLLSRYLKAHSIFIYVSLCCASTAAATTTA